MLKICTTQRYASHKLSTSDSHTLTQWIWSPANTMQLENCSKGSWLLATYLIPGCVAREVKLGSESSSGTGAGSGSGGVWKSENLEIWESANLEIQESGNLHIWQSVLPKNKKKTEWESIMPKMFAGSWLAGEEPPGPFWNIFHNDWPEKILPCVPW